MSVEGLVSVKGVASEDPGAKFRVEAVVSNPGRMRCSYSAVPVQL